ncbi:neural cell adhesion molecule 2-like [Haliotis asinina]|uniref:neural cell adhesion molecule 2-like n=1 Tax=Haliotis asinina TaxID=109174 RepID=UPI0035318F37
MTDMKLLKHLVFLLFSVQVFTGETVRLTRPGQYAVLGTEVSFTCTVVDTTVTGLILFMRGINQSFQTVCTVEASTGKQVLGTEESPCSAVERQTNTYSLTIRNVSRNDSTVWMCQAGGMKSNNVTLDVQYPPTVEIHTVTPCSGFTFLVNEPNVALNCSVKGANPAPSSFTWYHEDVTLQNGPSPIYTISVTRSTGGQYRCTADNGIHPPGEDDVIVDVHYPPTVHVGDTKRVVTESEDLTLQCTADARPEVTSVVWTKGDEDRRVSDNGTLRLRVIHKDDAGIYVCTATNMVTSCPGRPQTKHSRASVTLEVQYSPTVEIHAVTPCSGFTFLVNESNVTLNCSVKGANPAPTSFTWYHEDVTLQNGPSPIYTISRVNRSSRGWYRCTANNGIHPPGEDGVQVDVHFPPILPGNNAKIVVNETEDVSISCQPEANPEVTSVVWTKKGARVSDTGTLYLSNIQHDAAGEYLCTANNEVTSCSGGTQRESSSLYVTLEVQYAPQVEYFGVTSGTRTTTVREHDNVTLQCDVRSKPASSIEIRNKTHSIGSSKGINPGRQTLTTMLLNVSCLEGGNYFCAAENLLGGASQTLQLQVSCVPRRDLSSSDELVFTSNLHENVTLSLTVIAFPQPTFTWRKKPNGRPISTTEAITDGVRVTGSVTIVDVKQEDYINYTVRVNNAEGTLDLEIPLLSKSRPHLPSNLTAVNIRPRLVTLRWEKGFNGGATQSFTIQYRQSGGQWTTHPARPTEDDTLQLDIDGLEPGTVYEFRINAQNEHGESNYTSTSVTTDTDPTNLRIIACAVSVVLVGVIVLTVVVLMKWRKKEKGQGSSMAHRGEGEEDRVVAENDMYETSADVNVTPSGGGVGNNDVYAVVNKPVKKSDTVEDLYAMPQKEKKKKNRGKTRKKLEGQTEDIYAQPEKKGNKKGKKTKKGLGAEHSGGGVGDERKEGQKTGIDEDGLLYVSVDFSGLPPASDTIKRSEEETQYVGIDFTASAVKEE